MPFLIVLLLLLSPAVFAAPPPIQLASKYHSDIDISQYWVSEKLDGVRAYWDGQHLISRRGNIFPAPKWFIKDFPTQALDGELWIAREQFERVSGIVRTEQANDEDWQSIAFMIFDLPSSSKRFTARLKVMQQLVDDSPSPYLKMIPQQKYSSQQALQATLDRIINDGGEGLMLHHVDAYYQVKRSQDLMKLKRYDDAEAVVMAYIPGKGKHSGRMGSLLVKTKDGMSFKIGSGFTNAERENPPKIGDIITYQYIGKTKNGVPRFATFLRIRVALDPDEK
ncbi:DNA ligase [Psychromonas sp. psych-6C06]|uniref:DNA ligase n=1 Tax=Psychromonas sp. psych-6C06 TaxID=2058089 RepID=UPI000C33C51A|nr:DNA ligase [Psychromonas sp. psych-6C06]PKF62225.1 DNA ligase [Psychromonas sp. psych-6C06]